MLRTLSPAHAALLRDTNGFIALEGGLHVRGACRAPRWHALRAAREGPDAIHALFPGVPADHVPFAQDCFGDQFLLCDDEVMLLEGETGKLVSLRLDLRAFLNEAERDPDEFLGLQPLWRYRQAGGELQPGQLLSWDSVTSAGGCARVRAMDALQRLRALAGGARRPI